MLQCPECFENKSATFDRSHGLKYFELIFVNIDLLDLTGSKVSLYGHLKKLIE
jgi:hypothetical protein